MKLCVIEYKSVEGKGWSYNCSKHRSIEFSDFCRFTSCADLIVSLWDDYISTCKMRISTFWCIILEMNWGIKYNYNIKSQTIALLKIVRKDCQFAQWALSQTSIVDTAKPALSVLLDGKLADTAIYQSQFVSTRDTGLLAWSSKVWSCSCVFYDVIRDTLKRNIPTEVLCICVFMCS